MGLEEEIMANEFEKSLKIITELTNRRAQTLESLHRHLTMLSSTLLGILAVFGVGASASPLFRWAIVLGATSLFLCLLSGIYCMWQYYRVLDRLVKIQAEQYRKTGKCRTESAVFPKLYGFAATFCPAIFCIGVLFLLCGVVLRLKFPCP
nr:MAG TPA: hypothetical protein [Caudoviricetes sp.]